MEHPQSTNSLLMVRPSKFGFNTQTAQTNAFQHQPSEQDTHQKALKEFDQFVEILQLNGLNVIVAQDSPEPAKPDAIFPNNWVSFHPDGTVRLYPMATPNRQAEVRAEVLQEVGQYFEINQLLDLRQNQQLFLEGTGSIVFDHLNKIGYACQSVRTNIELFKAVCDQLDYKSIWFNAVDQNSQPIYHTNVMLSIGTDFAIICTESIQNSEHQQQVLENLKATHKVVIEITFTQMNQFLGNVLEVTNLKGEKLILMSQTAENALTPAQKNQLESVGRIISPNIKTIETIGGGSVRCMLAEIFLPRK